MKCDQMDIGQEKFPLTPPPEKKVAKNKALNVGVIETILFFKNNSHKTIKIYGKSL